MTKYENITTEIKIGTMTFMVSSFFRENGGESINDKLVKLMEREQEKLINKAIQYTWQQLMVYCLMCIQQHNMTVCGRLSFEQLRSSYQGSSPVG